MTRTAIAGVVMVSALLAAAGPVSAEHGGGGEESRPRPSPSLDLDVRIGLEGFRLGGRVLGLDGLYGAWLSGRVSRDGVTLDGRVQEPRRSYGFTLDASLTEWQLRTSREQADRL